MAGWDARRCRLTHDGLAALLKRYGLGGNEAWLLWTLADFDHRERATGLRKGVVWPTLAMLSDRSGLTIRAVRTSRDKLARSGLVTVTPLPPELNGCQDRGPAVTLHWDRLLGQDPAASRTGDPVTRQGQTLSNVGGDPAARQGACNKVELIERTVVVAISAAEAVGADCDDRLSLDAAAGPETPGSRPADPPNPLGPLPSAEADLRTGARVRGELVAVPEARPAPLAPPPTLGAPPAPPVRVPEPVRGDEQRGTPLAGHADWLLLLPPAAAGIPPGAVYDALCAELRTYAALRRWRELLREELLLAKHEHRKVSWERRVELACIATAETTPGQRAAAGWEVDARRSRAALAQQARAELQELPALLTRLLAAESAPESPPEAASADSHQNQADDSSSALHSV